MLKKWNRQVGREKRQKQQKYNRMHFTIENIEKMRRENDDGKV